MEEQGAEPESPPLARANGQKPKLADGVELIGEYKGSGFKEPPYLARRADGQVLQLPRLLYLVATKTDGRRSYAEIARAVSSEFGRDVSDENVEFLADKKLRPIGVLAAQDGSSPKLARPNPLLALNFRAAVVPPALVNFITTVFRPLFWPLIVAASVAGFALLDWWLFFQHGIAQSVRHLLNEPVFFLVVFGLIVLSAALHECGHATGCRYGGARPGVMGVGLYLVWPAFYTDVTDAYRLSKGGRLRTDLGGVYFNALFLLGTLAVYAITRLEVLIVVIVLLQLEMFHQFLPFLRLDGYYVIADLTGVPDIFARIKPVLASLLPGRKPDRRVSELKGWVRVVVTVWVLFAAAFLIYVYGMMLLHLPTILGTAWQSFLALMRNAGIAFAQGQTALGIFDALQLLLLALPSLGLAWTLVQLLRRAMGAAWGRTQGRPLQRATAFLAMAAAALLLVLAWTPPRATYQPIPPNARGTLSESFSNASSVVPPLLAPLLPLVPASSPSPNASASPSSSPDSPSPAASPSTSAADSPSSSPAPTASPSPSASP
jgi:putative peptide zinc metalloprotease protein